MCSSDEKLIARGSVGHIDWRGAGNVFRTHSCSRSRFTPLKSRRALLNSQPLKPLTGRHIYIVQLHSDVRNYITVYDAKAKSGDFQKKKFPWQPEFGPFPRPVAVVVPQSRCIRTLFRGATIQTPPRASTRSNKRSPPFIRDLWKESKLILIEAPLDPAIRGWSLYQHAYGQTGGIELLERRSLKLVISGGEDGREVELHPWGPSRDIPNTIPFLSGAVYGCRGKRWKEPKEKCRSHPPMTLSGCPRELELCQSLIRMRTLLMAR
ncbi:unnamed protein product [Leuciscus chuanchicus]